MRVFSAAAVRYAVYRTVVDESRKRRRTSSVIQGLSAVNT